MSKTWTMRDGTKIAVKDMDDNHLVNATNMLRRNVEKYRWAQQFEGLRAMQGMMGEMALDYAERDLEYALELEPEEFLDEMFETYKTLMWYVRRRGLSSRLVPLGETLPGQNGSKLASGNDVKAND